MKKLLSKKNIIIFISLIFFLEIILIAHRKSFNINLIANFYIKDIGIKESLEINNQFKVALEIKNLIEKYNLKNFKLSPSLKGDISYQRVIEVSYPVKLYEKSINYFEKKNIIIKNCKLIDNLKLITLYECRE
jgi:hypothetical protein